MITPQIVSMIALTKRPRNARANTISMRMIMIFLSGYGMFEKVSQEAKELVFVLDGIGRKADPLAGFY